MRREEKKTLKTAGEEHKTASNVPLGDEKREREGLTDLYRNRQRGKESQARSTLRRQMSRKEQK